MALLDNLSAFWQFEEASPASTALDFMGNHNGTYENSADTVAGGKKGRGVEFGGATEDIVVSHSTALDPGTGDFTIAFWLDTSDTDGIVIEKSDGSGNNWYVYLDGSGYIRFRIESVNGGSITSSVTVNNGAYHFIVCRRDSGSTCKIYVDDTERASDTDNGANVANTNSLYMGRLANQSGSPLAGIVDQMMVYQRALTTAEMTYLYRSGAGFSIRVSAVDILAGRVRGIVSSATDVLRGRVRGIVSSVTDILRGRVRGIVASATDILKGRVFERYAGSTEILKGRIYERYVGSTEILKGRILTRYAGSTEILRSTIEQQNGYDIQVYYPGGQASPQVTSVANITAPGVTFSLTTLPSAGTTFPIDVSVWEKGDLYTNKDPKYTKRYVVDSNGDFTTAIPNAPSSPIGIALAAGSIKYTWDYDPSNQQVAPGNFELQNNINGAGFTALTTVSYPTRTYTKTGYTDLDTVVMRVRADDGSGNVSAWTTATTVTADALALGDVPFVQVIRG